MRILGRLAVTAGATAVVLLASPTANAADEESLNGVSRAAQQEKAGGLDGLAGIKGVPVVSDVTNALLYGVGGGVASGLLSGATGGGVPVGGTEG